MIDHRLGLRLAGRGVARDKVVAALSRTERKIGSRFSVVLCVLHAQHRCVEIACLAIVRAGIGDVVDGDHLETLCGRGIRGAFARSVDGGRQGNGFAELAAVELAALEIFYQIGDEKFHAVNPCFKIPLSYAPISKNGKLVRHVKWLWASPGAAAPYN